MKLVSLKCSGCGSTLEVVSNSKQVKCEFCNMVTLIDDEIIRVEHKIINDDNDNTLQSAIFYLEKLKDYTEAEKMFKKYVKCCPNNSYAWLSLVRCLSLDFTEIPSNTNELFRFFDSYCKTETNEELLKRNTYVYYAFLIKKFTKDFSMSKIYDNDDLIRLESWISEITNLNLEITKEFVNYCEFYINDYKKSIKRNPKCRARFFDKLYASIVIVGFIVMCLFFIFFLYNNF